MSDQDSAKSVEILQKLKSAILNIDWEISDENIGMLNQELSALGSAWQGQKVHTIYLQILGALSQYIASTKEQGNPGAFPMLRTVFESLEDMVVNPSTEEEQTKKVMEHVEAYNELKNAVATKKAAPAPEPEPEPEPETEPTPEPEVVESPSEPEPSAVEEESSTINRLLDDKEDHTTDSIFDSMLDEMVQVEAPEEEDAPAPPPPPKAPPARPPVQAAYNKDDGTEVEADRNIDERFDEADELLDNFFEDDVPAPGAAAQKKGDEFDLSALDEEEGDVLDLDQATQEEAAGHELEEGLELSLEDESVADDTLDLEPAAGQEPVELEHVEDGDLDIFKVDEEGPEEVAQPEVAEEFPEMESALDDFFAGDEEAAPQPVAGPQGEAGAGDDLGDVDSALDDFFDEDALEEPEAAAPEASEALELEIPSEAAEPELAPAAESTPIGTVEGLKALLLSVDWEVDDQLLERVDAEIFALSQEMAGNDIALIHLNLLKTVIHHIGREQSQVISESMACLKMVTESLEGLLSCDQGEESIYAAQAVSSFVDWHELVVAEFEKRLDAARSQGGDLAESIEELELSADEGSPETQKLKKEILSEVRELLNREMQTIRRELSAKD